MASFLTGFGKGLLFGPLLLMGFVLVLWKPEILFVGLAIVAGVIVVSLVLGLVAGWREVKSPDAARREEELARGILGAQQLLAQEQAAFDRLPPLEQSYAHGAANKGKVELLRRVLAGRPEARLNSEPSNPYRLPAFDYKVTYGRPDPDPRKAR
ncbi:MAG: hypothetical protein V2J26_07300 [Pacificimonas sp.]|jgi:hypothetical protein|nr:hypothetical protein [Pacificimonas sp.]